MVKKPPLKLQTTTLWYYPSQQVPGEPQGTPSFQGATPAYVVWNLLSRFTREGDLVVDPFCGGGTTLDVARGLGRRALGYDVAPVREDVFRADARDLPLEDGVADFVFMDPPYSTHIDYSEDERCIGKLDAFEPAYFEAMAAVFAEVDRVLRDRRFLALYVSDSFRKGKGFVGIGARLYALLEERFRPVDHVAVVRGNRTLEKPAYHRAAAEGNFFLRGFNHLLIFKKERGPAPSPRRQRPAREGAPRRRRRAGD
jgi:DNA modification methylase